MTIPDMAQTQETVHISGGNARQPKSAGRTIARAQREHLEQCTLFEWIDYMAQRDERFKLIFAIPNGGERHAYVATKLKAEGVRAGVPDIFVALPRPADPLDPGRTYSYETPDMWRFSTSSGLFIEMKIKPNTVKAHQREWLTRLRLAGYMTAVCWSFEEAQQLIAKYMGVKL